MNTRKRARERVREGEYHEPDKRSLKICTPVNTYDINGSMTTVVTCGDNSEAQDETNDTRFPQNVENYRELLALNQRIKTSE